MSKERLFRPARPRLKELRGAALFAVLLVILLYAALRDGSSSSLAAAAGSALMMTGGLWLALHDRWPGRPELFMDAQGLRYSRFGREQSMRWDEVASIEALYDRNQMRFVPVSGGKPITTRLQMVTEGGEWFAMLLEEYWTPPKERRADRLIPRSR